MSSLFDTHCHLDMDPLASEVDEVLQRAEAAGVSRMLTIGCAKSCADLDSALQVARRAPAKLRASVGVHPHDARFFDHEVEGALEALAADPLVVGIGETGLDFYYENSPIEAQEEAFRRTIAIARRVGKALIIHTRQAAERTLAILREEKASEVGGVIHCFSEDYEFAKAALEMNFRIGLSGIVTFKSAKAIQDAAQRLPLDALLVETDAPFLAPVPMRGKANEPAFVRHTANFVAKLRGEEQEHFDAATHRNGQALFGWQD